MTIALDPQISDTATVRTHTQCDLAVSEPSCPDASQIADSMSASRPGTPTSGAARSAPNAQTVSAAPDPSSPAASSPAIDQRRSAAGGLTSTGTSQYSIDAHGPHARPGGWLRDPVIGVLADVLDDLEKVRIANANRVRILTRTEADSDGEERGFGLTEDHPEVKKLALTVKALEAAEHDAILNLQRALRKHPLAAFQKRHKGLGEKQFARLLAVIGDPYYNDLHQRPRTVSELWAYCGFHVIRTSSSSQVVRDTQSIAAAAGSTSTPGASHGSHTQVANAPGVAPKRTRGQQSNWSEDARKRVWVIASAMPKFPGGHYEHVYRQAREKYADAVHPTECVRCGPAGKPAPAGTDLSDGHKHARAIRIVAKELLKDMWRESRDLYHPEGNQA